MKNLIILSIYLLVVTAGFVYIYQNDTEDAEEATIRQTEEWRLELEKRLGPKPFFLLVGKRINTQMEEDSLFHYLSRFTRSELIEVKHGIEENRELREFIDNVIWFNYGS